MRIGIVLLMIIMNIGVVGSAQTTSIAGLKESKIIIDKVIKKGCNLDDCDSSDQVCLIMNDQTKKAYSNLKKKTVGVVKTFGSKLAKEITSYNFADSFDHYFKLDSAYSQVDFYKKEGNRNTTFGASNRVQNSMELSSIVPISNAGDVFLNDHNFSDAILIFPAFIEYPLIIKNNRIYVLFNKEIIEGKLFFRSYSIKEINSRFKPLTKEGR